MDKNSYLAALATSCSTILYGYSIGFSSPSTVLLKNVKIFDDGSASLFGSLLTITFFFGAISAGRWVDAYGRKRIIMLSSLPSVIGWILLYTFEFDKGEPNQLQVGRAFTGFGAGLIMVSTPNYITEISTQRSRGFLGATVQLNITLGICVAYLIGMSDSWKGLTLFGIVLCILNVLMMYGFPESPRWLVSKQQLQEADAALLYLRNGGNNGKEIAAIQQELSQGVTFAMRDVLQPQNLRPLLITSAVMVFQQTGGINAVMFHTESIFWHVGFNQYASLSTVILGFVQVIATGVACLLMDKIGRRQLLLVAGVLMALSCFGFSGFYLLDTQTRQNATFLALGCLIIYIVGFSIGWGPVPVLLVNELLSGGMRAFASSLSLCVNSFMAFLIVYSFLPMLTAFGSSFMFLAYGISCTASVLFTYKVIPETKGKTLDEIQSLFAKKQFV